MHADFKATYTDGVKVRTGAFLDVAVRLVRDYSAKSVTLDWSLPTPTKEIWKKVKTTHISDILGNRFFFIRSQRDAKKKEKRLK
jgi:hypothetical protein